jgi:hypothetical protein
MTKKELQKQIDELRKRIEILENEWIWPLQPEPFLGSTHNLCQTNQSPGKTAK